MAKLVWDKAGEHIYETGVSKGVLYVMGDNGTYGDGLKFLKVQPVLKCLLFMRIISSTLI